MLVEWLSSETVVSKKFSSPAEFLAPTVSISKSYSSPTEWREALFALTLTFKTLVDFSGLTSDSLSHTFNVLVLLDQPLLHQWFVVGGEPAGQIEHMFFILGSVGSLAHRWRILPHVDTLFDENIHLPVGKFEKTP